VKTASKTLALLAGAALLSSCATLRKDPVVCGVIGSVIGGVAGGFIGAAAADQTSPTFPAIAGSTIGFAGGAYGGYQLCKRLPPPHHEKAAEKSDEKSGNEGESK
jgi:hypothetical protein